MDKYEELATRQTEAQERIANYLERIALKLEEPPRLPVFPQPPCPPSYTSVQYGSQLNNGRAE